MIDPLFISECYIRIGTLLKNLGFVTGFLTVLELTYQANLAAQEAAGTHMSSIPNHRD